MTMKSTLPAWEKLYFKRVYVSAPWLLGEGLGRPLINSFVTISSLCQTLQIAKAALSAVGKGSPGRSGWFPAVGKSPGYLSSSFPRSRGLGKESLGMAGEDLRSLEEEIWACMSVAEHPNKWTMSIKTDLLSNSMDRHYTKFFTHGVSLNPWHIPTWGTE